MNIQTLRDKIRFSKKRQYGSEKNVDPLPVLHAKPSTFQLAFNRVAIVLTVLFWISYILSIFLKQLVDGPQNYNFTVEAFGYTAVMTFLTFSALMYLIARQGAYERFSKHTRVPRAVLEKHFSQSTSDVTVLIPSYNEEVSVVKKTMMSAALQEFPKKRVVLLIDDNPNPIEESAIEKLNATRAIANDIQQVLSIPKRRFQRAFNSFKQNKKVSNESTLTLANHYKWAANYISEIASKESVEDHVDLFFVEQVLLDLAQDFRLIHKALQLSVQDKAQISPERIQELYQRLVWIFSAELTYFERKKYASLSKEFNKAMNLNSYIGLMGGSYVEEDSPDGKLLIQSNPQTKGSISFPDSEFLLTLDADSILLKDYCLRLIYLLQQSGNERVAVTQTPYSSYRGAFSRIERLSGATTDIQHIIHQGMTRFGATFWVGANAVIRKIALDDIVEKENIGGFEIKRYVQDRTVIEDTESSVDLILSNWQLVNYPERLSYSATPPDFGSLIIQRRRWANGGLLILPKLFTYIRKRKSKNLIVPWSEVLLRINYMASIAWASFGLVFLLAYPFDGQLLSTLVLLTAVPYFISMAIDLKYCGYRYSDILNIYGFNLILLPVNLAGVLKSLEQAVTGKKIPFARTPKVKNRTAASLQYLLIPLIIVLFSSYITYINYLKGNWGNATYAGFNMVLASWAIFAYIGFFNFIEDMWIGLTSWLYVETKNQQ